MGLEESLVYPPVVKVVDTGRKVALKKVISMDLKYSYILVLNLLMIIAVLVLQIVDFVIPG